MISVCMATYNGERFIREQIESILPQLSECDELIISDDGSTDKTLEIINSYDDKRIFLLHHKRNFTKKNFPRGYYCSNNFSYALKHAKGDIIILSDQDDIWCDKKVEKIKQSFEKNDLIISNFSIIDKENRIISSKYFIKNPITKNWLMNLHKNIYFGCSMAMKRSLLLDCLPIPNNVVSYDSWIGSIAMLKKYRLHFIDEPLFLYRRHGENLSNATEERSDNPLWFKFFWRIQLIFLLITWLTRKKI